MRHPSFVWGMALWALAFGCSHRPPGPESGETFLVQVAGGGVTQASLTDSTVTGPDMRLNLSDSGLRGEAFNRPVNVQWSQDEVTGLVGRTPVQLTVRREGNQIHARGLYEGRLSDLRVSRAGIDGPIGSCSYSLKPAAGGYQGFRSCSQAPQSPITVQIPDGLWQKSDGAQIALLALLLAH